MSTQDLKMLNDLKKKKILENLKSKPFSEQKSSAKLLQTIQRQRETINISNHQQHSTSQAKSSDQMYDLLLKQRKVVLQLDEENVTLIKQNTQLKSILNSTDSKLKSAHKSNIQLQEQNSSLKQQLLISQINCAKMVTEVNRLKRKVNQTE